VQKDEHRCAALAADKLRFKALCRRADYVDGLNSNESELMQ
jgi:hypothetical protein